MKEIQHDTRADDHDHEEYDSWNTSTTASNSCRSSSSGNNLTKRSTVININISSTTLWLCLVSILFLVSLLFVAGFDHTVVFQGFISPTFKKTTKLPEKPQFPLKCAIQNQTQTCPTNYYPTTTLNPKNPTNQSCPSFFQWIQEDLKPWKEKGITREMIEGARRTAHFRLVIIDGKAYVEKYRKSIQTRDLFSLWGILQLLRLYPGKLPDLELMFDCDDRPVVRVANFMGPDSRPPPLFRYCSDHGNLDIVFPDWSFWGWAETNIRPWQNILKDIKEGNKRIKWKDRLPYAYWKGNPHVASTRKNLLRCNVNPQHDWNARIYIQNWEKETREGYKQSKLEDQCTYRYKIYIEGWAWSVSEKYILACDSMNLYITSHFFDFFIRGMVPLQHYWPIRDNSKCTSLQFAVEWGNNHTQEAQAIGEAAGKFMQEDLKMDYVYDYMFHLLNEYAKLLKFKPTIPPGAVEVCSETMACSESGNNRKFMLESLVMSPSDTVPCTMPPPFDPQALQAFIDRKANLIKQVENWEDEYWLNPHRKP